jgi:hypothetical protein
VAGPSAYRFRDLADVPILPQHDRIVSVVLQDGRQLEGELIVLTDRFEIAGTLFEPWEIEEIDDANLAQVMCMSRW